MRTSSIATDSFVVRDSKMCTRSLVASIAVLIYSRRVGEFTFMVMSHLMLGLERLAYLGWFSN